MSVIAGDDEYLDRLVVRSDSRPRQEDHQHRACQQHASHGLTTPFIVGSRRAVSLVGRLGKERSRVKGWNDFRGARVASAPRGLGPRRADGTGLAGLLLALKLEIFLIPAGFHVELQLAVLVVSVG